MRWCRRRSLLWFMVVVVAGSVGPPALAGCSHDAGGGKPPSPSAQSPRPSGTPGAQSPVPVGTSPAGVTTRVDAPADSTEEEYYQACHAAKVWMDDQPSPGARDALFEPYLAMVQASPSGSAGSWNTRWTNMTPARQAAVIVAARAAANDECG